MTRWDGPLTRAHKPARRGDGSIWVWLAPLLVFWLTIIFLASEMVR